MKKPINLEENEIKKEMARLKQKPNERRFLSRVANKKESKELDEKINNLKKELKQFNG